MSGPNLALGVHMTVLNVENLGKFFGAHTVFDSVSFSVGRGERLAVVGKNGEGKTTLLRVLAGELERDRGTFSLVGRATLGYASQTTLLRQGTVLSHALSARQDILDLADKMARLESEIAETKVAEKQKELLCDYAKTTARFEVMEGYNLEHTAKAVLAGLGFEPSEFNRDSQVLSGGEKMRLTLAKLLLRSPDVLLLDEPTNHLDLLGAEWLESFLQSYPGAVVVVSHDRYFMDSVCHKVLELKGGKGQLYTGNYSAYIRQKEEKYRLEKAAYERQSELITRTKALIQKWKGTPTRVSMARSREKMLARLDILEKPKGDKKDMGLKFDMEKASGNEVLSINKLSKQFNARPLFRDFTWNCRRGQRIALVGHNGCGKTTLIRCLTGAMQDFEGEIRYGSGVSVGYFSQLMDDLREEFTIFQEVKSLGLEPQEVRDVCGRFLFSGEDVDKKVGALSGGEKNRLMLLKLVVGKANLLFLDEPTNHLDMASKEVLENALLDFPGTLIFASHDRFFMDRLATQLWVFQDGCILVYNGKYTQWRQQSLSGAPVEYDNQRPSFLLLGSTPGLPHSKDLPAENRTAISKKRVAATKQLKESKEDINRAKLVQIEAEIEALEEQHREMVDLFQNPDSYLDPEALPWKEFNALTTELERLYEVWEMLMGEGND